MRIPGVAACLVLAACGDPAISIFVGRGAASTPDTFYDLPFPNDVRRAANGRIDLTGYPTQTPLIDDYIAAIEEHLDGFGLNSGIYFRFDGELDPDSLPSPEESIGANASVYLVNVDRDSPRFGQRTPLKVRFRAQEGSSIGPNWLAILPYPGFPLDEGTTYAAVVSDRVASADVGFVIPSVDFAAVRDPAPAMGDLAEVQAAMAPLWSYLDDAGGDERENAVTATVFTTQHATEIVGLLRDRIDSLPVPQGHDLVPLEDNETGLAVWDGVYEAPNFQRGEVPYRSEGGDIQLADDGMPLIQRGESLRFSVTVPNGPTPPSGWPIILFQHGTGGGFHSYLNNGTAEGLAAEGMATVSTDQVLHGPRNPGGNPDLDFFNFLNPLAARDNTIQGAADIFSLARMITALEITDGDREIRFDPDRIMYFGHSQGATTGAPYAAYAKDCKGAVMSGSGGVLYLAVLNKTEPVDIPSLLAAALRDEPLDEFNPSLALLQMWIERADSVNYGAKVVRDPPPDHPRTPIYISEGFTDHYAPIPNIEAYATSVGVDLVGPVIAPVAGLALRGRPEISAPVVDNLDGVTAVLVQYTAPPDSDGHFVAFEVPTAIIQSRKFLQTLSATGTATLVAP
jgi:pimeloyl-ACP methyl ester carboxylesterase